MNDCYAAIFVWINENRFKITGPMFNIYHISPYETQSGWICNRGLLSCWVIYFSGIWHFIKRTNRPERWRWKVTNPVIFDRVQLFDKQCLCCLAVMKSLQKTVQLLYVTTQRYYLSEKELHFFSSNLKSQHLAARDDFGLEVHFWYNFFALFWRISCTLSIRAFSFCRRYM